MIHTNKEKEATMAKVKKEKQNIHIRMDKELHDAVRKLSDENMRTITGQIHAMLYAQLKEQNQ